MNPLPIAQFHNGMATLRLRDDRLLTITQPWVMGVINRSPNSFFRPHASLESALETAERMVKEGATILDIGGEATNPFVNIVQEAPAVQVEIDRVVPVVSAIKKRFNVLVSVDTSRPAVMRAAAEVGADMINDQRALREVDALQTVATLRIPVCLMHFFNPPREPGSSHYADLLQSIQSDLRAAIDRCQKGGIAKDRLIIDPGFGQGHYGKNSNENFFLLTHLSAFVEMGFPVLSGWSRKSMVGDVLKADVSDRLYGSIAADTIAAYQGAAIIRTHDVKACSDAIKMAAHARNLAFSS